MKVLGIETSCDETGVAIYDLRQGLISHALYSQVNLHREYGGVVPELASRDHVRKLLPLIMQALKEADLTRASAGGEGGIAGVAYTCGPGLLGALLVGASVARSLAYAWGVPALGVHHMEAHLLATGLEDLAPDYPFVALLVSGGHTMLVEVSALGEYETLGETLDDAAGEAFDKTAKLLGLPYPGGPAIAKLAESGRAGRFRFPRPMLDKGGLNFSFSGLKTAVVNRVRELDLDAQTRADIARAFQEAVVDTLVHKCVKAMRSTGFKDLVVAGGVGANRQLRERLAEGMDALGGRVQYPRPELCTDNGAMVAYAGCLRLSQGQTDEMSIEARARWRLDELAPPPQSHGDS